MTLGQLIVKMGVDVRDFDAKMSKSEDTINQFADKLSGIGRKMSLFVTTPLVGMATGAIAMATSFEKAMAEVSTLVDDASMMEPLTQSIKDLSREFGEMPVDQAKALYQIISAGATSAAQATDILTASNKLAIGGVTDVATAADGLTTIMNAFGTEVGNATNVSDAMFVAMRAGKTTIDELSNAIGAVAPLAAQAGASLEEVLAATAALTKGGVKTRVAMRGLRAIMASIVKPTNEAAELAEKLGLEFNAAALQSMGFADFLAMVEEKTGGSTEQMALLFGGVEALVPALALTGKAGDDFAEILGNMAAKAGETDAAFEKMSETSAFKFDKALAAIKVSMIELGAIMLPILMPVIDVVTEMINMLSKVPRPIMYVVIAMGALAAAIGPVLVGGAAMIKLFSGVAVILGSTLAPMLLVGGALMIGLALLSGWFIKNARDAAEARRATEEYANALGKLEHNTLIHEAAGIEKRIEGLRAMQQTGWVRDQIRQLETQQLAVAKAFNALPPMIKGVNSDLADTDVVIAGLGDTIEGLGDTSVEMANRLGRLRASLQEFSSLQQFRLFTMDDALPEIAQAINRVTSLRTAVEELEGDVAALGSQAPSGLLNFLDTMRNQLGLAEQYVKNLAEEFDKLWEKMDNVVAGVTGGGPPVLEIQTLVIDPPEFSREYMAMLSLYQARLRVTAAAVQFFGNAMEQGRSQFKSAMFGAQQFVAQLTPMGLAARLLAQVFESLQPALEALLLPVDMLARAIGAMLVPVLRLLFPVIKGVAIVLTYLWEVTARVAQGLSWAIGSAIRAIGLAIDRIPFVSGGPIIRAGEALLDFSKNMGEAIGELQGARAEIRDLDFDTALDRTTENLNNLSEAVIGAVSGFKYADLRHAAVSPSLSSPDMATSGTAAGGTVITGNTFSPTINVSAEGGDGRGAYRQMYEELDRLSLGDRAAREIFHSFPEPR